LEYWSIGVMGKTRPMARAAIPPVFNTPLLHHSILWQEVIAIEFD
jgi:hypothetical protein